MTTFIVNGSMTFDNGCSSDELKTVDEGEGTFVSTASFSVIAVARARGLGLIGVLDPDDVDVAVGEAGGEGSTPPCCLRNDPRVELNDDGLRIVVDVANVALAVAPALLEEPLAPVGAAVEAPEGRPPLVSMAPLVSWMYAAWIRLKSSAFPLGRSG